MPVNLVAPDPAGLHAVAGLELGTARAGIRKPDRRDLLLVRIAAGATAAGVFTRNRFCAAPVTVCRENLAATQGRAARHRRQHRLRQCRHRPARPGQRPGRLRGGGRRARLPAPARCCRCPPASSSSICRSSA